MMDIFYRSQLLIFVCLPMQEVKVIVLIKCNLFEFS